MKPSSAREVRSSLFLRCLVKTLLIPVHEGLVAIRESGLPAKCSGCASEGSIVELRRLTSNIIRVPLL